MDEFETSYSREREEPDASRYYTFRLRKRDVRGLSLVLAAWFFWNEWPTVVMLAKALFNTIW